MTVDAGGVRLDDAEALRVVGQTVSLVAEPGGLPHAITLGLG